MTTYKVTKINYMTEEKKDYGYYNNWEDIACIVKGYKKNELGYYERHNSHWIIFVDEK